MISHWYSQSYKRDAGSPITAQLSEKLLIVVMIDWTHAKSCVSESWSGNPSATVCQFLCILRTRWISLMSTRQVLSHIVYRGCVSWLEPQLSSSKEHTPMMGWALPNPERSKLFWNTAIAEAASTHLSFELALTAAKPLWSWMVAAYAKPLHKSWWQIGDRSRNWPSTTSSAWNFPIRLSRARNSSRRAAVSTDRTPA